MNKVGINLLWMVPGKVGGSEIYLARLLSGLAERSSEIDYTIFGLPQLAEAHPDLAKTFKTAFAPVRGRMKSFRVFGENSWLAAQCRVRNIDLVHHAGGTLPIVPTPRPLLTIHDVQYLYYPEYFTRTKLAYLKMQVPRSAENARLILTPSEYARRTIIERLHIDSSLVRVVPHGVSGRERRPPDIDIRSHYGIAGPFFLYPAITYPHKNHLVLIDAFARLLKIHPDVHLVLTGGRGSVEVPLATEIRKLGIEDRVVRLGYVPRDHLDALYHQAVALTFPSRFEGFGIPVIEAMVRSCPVIAADATAVPEVVGDAGSLVSPDNPEEWCRSMADMLEDDEMRRQFVKAGVDRAKAFTWSRSADLLEEAYRDVLDTTL